MASDSGAYANTHAHTHVATNCRNISKSAPLTIINNSPTPVSTTPVSATPSLAADIFLGASGSTKYWLLHSALHVWPMANFSTSSSQKPAVMAGSQYTMLGEGRSHKRLVIIIMQFSYHACRSWPAHTICGKVTL